MEKKQSEAVRDINEPGWREREAAREAVFLAAVPVQKSAPRRPEPSNGRPDTDAERSAKG